MARMKIDSYSFGRMVVAGMEYDKDLIILPNKLLLNWWRKAGHIFAPDDFIEVLSEDLELMILGLGAYGLVKVEPELEKIFHSKGIECRSFYTARAVKAFNENCLLKKTAGAFHLTC